MVPEPDHAGLFATLTGVLGGGGILWKMFQKQSEQGVQIKNNERELHEAKEKHERHDAQLVLLRENAVRTETTLAGFGETLREVRSDVKKIAESGSHP